MSNNEEKITQIYAILASSIPEGTTKKEALRAALKFAADCIQQIGKSDHTTLDASIGILKLEVENFNKIYAKV